MKPKETRNNESEKPVIVCYCNRITDLEIIKTVQEEGLTTVDEVKKHLRENLISNCAELNPTGECCHRAFDKVIRRALRESI
jgi:bacterioferritin-associated ferredoxin